MRELEDLKREVSDQKKTKTILEDQLEQLDDKYTEAMQELREIKLSEKKLEQENQILKQTSDEVT